MINWKLRLKNKATLAALISAVVVFIFEVTTALGVALPVSQEQVMSGVAALLTLFVGLGVITDPTTKGVSDSDRALLYEEPFSSATNTTGRDDDDVPANEV